jgi:hypothetical protein
MSESLPYSWTQQDATILRGRSLAENKHDRLSPVGRADLIIA